MRPSVRSGDALRRAAAALLLATLLCLGGAAAALRPVSAQDLGEGIGVTHLGWRDVTFGGATLTRLTGLVVNERLVPVGQVEIAARFRAAEGTPVLRIGTTIADLPELAPGESSPFTILVGPLSSSAVGHVDVTLGVRSADGRRYRALQVEDVVTRTVGGAPALFGWLRNVGDAYASASNTNIIAGFWDARGLRETHAATMPIVYQPGTLVGQGHAPDMRYPWFLRLPDEPWTKLEFWVVAKRYADGLWPVPLGVIDLARDDQGGRVTFAGRLVHCGQRPVTEFALVSSAAAAAGGVLTFTLNVVTPQRPIVPGDDVPIRVTWPGLDPTIPVDRVVHLPLSFDVQSLPPRSMPCTRAERPAMGLLPWLGRGAMRAPTVGPRVDPRRADH